MKRKEMIYYRDAHGDHIVTSYACDSCGWWYALDDLNEDRVFTIYYHSILKSIPIDSKFLPVDLLIKELNKSKHYSKQAQQTIDESITRNAIDRLELIDCKRLMELFSLNKTPKEYRPWRNLSCFQFLENSINLKNDQPPHNYGSPVYKESWKIGNSIN